MAPFTSRGPNVIEPNILKPDITAPGFNILAAWSEAASPLGVPSDNRVAKFNIISGTSMACPHVAGVAALIKAIHPDWSSAAIRSALMTTATAFNNLGKLITDVVGNFATPLQYGAGHIQPAKAADPGLVYDASYEDYLLFLCSTTGNLLDPTFVCPLILPSPSNFNYPSVTITKLAGVVTVQRTLTNVGVGNATYTVTVDTPPGFSVTISPATLFFSATGEKQSFSITVQATEIAPVDAFGWFYWSDGIHQVVYIVYLGEHAGDKTFQEIEDVHHSYLHSVKGSREEAKACVVYSYKNVINGFSAVLTPDEAHQISGMDGVISVFHSDPRESRPQTTRSWDFISLLESNWDVTQSNSREQLLNQADYGQNVVVGVLDSGVWPESESFNDVGMGPIPSTWKGICQTGDDFNSSHCNRKLVGARYYLSGYEAVYGPLDPTIDFRSPRDISGHGTHTSSTVGGRNVPNAASLGGLGVGNATGGAPLVRLAIYKVCWNIPENQGGRSTCMDDDMLAAFDAAIADGVDVLSVSIGARNGSRPYTRDAIAIGSLHAVKRNIVVACSAGNLGPTPSTVSNIAPWFITVGASSIDRVFSSPVLLGNGIVAETMRNGTLSPELVVGKAVFCWTGDTFQALEVQRAGGVAAVLGNLYPGVGVIGRPYLIPGTVVLSDERMKIYNYTQTDPTPTATLTPATTLIGGTTNSPTPFMAPFSSRGPNAIEPNILKPDITAPGLNILAAWSEAAPPLVIPSDNRVTKYQLASGTSMSCPHVAGVAALIKAIHPDWSSAAIRSALMTTANPNNNLGNIMTDAVGNIATPFQYGGGHIQPSKAADPGLVYNASYSDYLLFLCSSIGNVLDTTFNCPTTLPSPSNLNYPSLAIANLNGVLTVERTVTNVGAGNATYTVQIVNPQGYTVGISPPTLFFNATGEKQTFNITVQATVRPRGNAFGWYVWSDGIHSVSSPIAMSTV
ncbi:hypothetical protein ABFX02_13G090700 [Erythranthe guttata]